MLGRFESSFSNTRKMKWRGEDIFTCQYFCCMLSILSQFSHYIPFPKTKHFVGRAGILDTLKMMLFIRKECQKAVIVGLGSVGKTQVALQLAYG